MPPTIEAVHSGARRKRQIPENVDIVVIGAGLGGLSAALQLAKNGFKVLVVERHDVPGGYAHTFKRKKYTFDVSLHYIGGLRPECMMGGVLDYYGVLDKLELYHREKLFSVEFPDEIITLPNDIGEIIHFLGERHPEDKEGLVKLLNHLRTLKYHAVGQWLDPDYNVPVDDRLTTKYWRHSFQDVVKQFISSPRLIATLGRLWMYIGLPPSQSTATFSTCVFCASFIDGGYYIKGGSMSLSNAMTERLRELGGEVLTLEEVENVVVEDKHAVGVKLKKGDIVPAKAVVSNANPYVTFFDLIQDGDISDIYRYRLKQMTTSLSFYAMYLGLDVRPSEIGIDYDNYFLAVSDDIDEAWRRTANHELHHTEYSLTNYEYFDDSMFPKDTGTLAIVECTLNRDWIDMDKNTYKREKAKLEEQLFAKYVKRFPDLANHVKIREFATPRTMVRYSRNHMGAVYGLAQTVEQSNAKRLKNRAPIKGLYLTGAWTWAGGGYEGAVLSGVQTASSVMEDFDAPTPTAIPRIALPNDMQKPLVAKPPASSPKQPKGPSTMPTPPQAATAPAPSSAAVPASTDSPIDVAIKARLQQGFRPTFPYRLPVRVYYEDTDAQGITYHASYIRFIDRGRVETINEIFNRTDRTSLLQTNTVNVYSLAVRYARPSRLGDDLEVRTSWRVVTPYRAAFDQRIVNIKTGDLIVDAVVEAVMLDENERLTQMPDWLIALIHDVGNRGFDGAQGG